MAMEERDETPEYEARSHSAGFLKKAARLAGKKRGSGKMKKGRTKKSRKSSR